MNCLFQILCILVLEFTFLNSFCFLYWIYYFFIHYYNILSISYSIIIIATLKSLSATFKIWVISEFVFSFFLRMCHIFFSFLTCSVIFGLYPKYWECYVMITLDSGIFLRRVYLFGFV